MNCFPHASRAGNEIAAPAGNTSRRTIVAARNAAMENVVWKNERLCVTRPATSAAAPTGIRIGAIAHAPVKATAVITLEKAQTRPSADRINARVESVTADVQLPLHGAARGTGKCHRTGTVVLRAAARLWSSSVGKIAADVPRIKFDRVNACVHIEPGRVDCLRCSIRVSGSMGATIISN